MPCSSLMNVFFAMKPGKRRLSPAGAKAAFGTDRMLEPDRFNRITACGDGGAGGIRRG